MIFIKNLSMLLLTLLTIFDISFMETISEDTCDAEDQVLAQFFVKLDNYVDRSQNNTQQITKLHEQFRAMEQKMIETQKRLEENQRILLEIQSNQRNTQQITELHEQFRAMEQKIDENQKRLEEKQKNIEKNLIILLEMQKPHNNLQDYINNPTTIVIQRRVDGSEDFNRTWNEYRNGFGKIDGEFFIGLEKVYKLTNSDRYELKITMEDFENNKVYANYDHFVIGSEIEKYVLKSLGSYNGTAGDALTRDLRMKFTTKDQDNDNVDGINCANERHGGWWYRDCSISNLNGKYSKYANNNSNVKHIMWVSFKFLNTLKFVEMKLEKFHT